MKMDQTCPHCGITEAAGSYCTKCLVRTQEDWLHRPIRSTAGIEAIKAKSVEQSRQAKRW